MPGVGGYAHHIELPRRSGAHLGNCDICLRHGGVQRTELWNAPTVNGKQLTSSLGLGSIERLVTGMLGYIDFGHRVRGCGHRLVCRRRPGFVKLFGDGSLHSLQSGDQLRLQRVDLLRMLVTGDLDRMSRPAAAALICASAPPP